MQIEKPDMPPGSNFNWILHYSFQGRIIEPKNDINIPWLNSLVCGWSKRMNGFDCKILLESCEIFLPRMASQQTTLNQLKLYPNSNHTCKLTPLKWTCRLQVQGQISQSTFLWKSAALIVSSFQSRTFLSILVLKPKSCFWPISKDLKMINYRTLYIAIYFRGI